MKLFSSRKFIFGAAILVCAVAAFAGLARYQAARTAAPSASMASMLPQGALLTIESPDFAALLHDWNASPEQKSWLASDNYSVFSNSRLFGRLNDARAEFESAAGLAPRQSSQRAATNLNGDFLTQIAGHESIFAWYDVGNLEFLYISRISSAQTGNLSLVKDRAAWTSRQVGGTTFYLRKSSSSAPAPDQQDAQTAAAQGRARTVAFAVVPDPAGDLLVLATREDLIANALQLMHPAPGAAAESIATEPWYTEASAALLPVDQAPALHMVLNLDRLVPLPYFRSYWVQRNVTDMSRYRAALSDLYREPHQFREYRALLLKSSDSPADEAFLRTLAAIVPPSGVHRAVATHDPDVGITALEEKLLGRITLEPLPDTEAPDPTLDAPQSGSLSDLETRIDAPAPVTPAVSNNALAQTLKSAGLDAVLTWSSAQPPATPGGLWVPIHSAVILQASSAWNAQTLQSALQQSLRGSLTAANLGIEFHADTAGGPTIYTLTGPKPLFLATLSTTSPNTAPGQVHLCLVADDRPLLLALLKQAATLAQMEAKTRPTPETLLAGFDHTSQRAPYARLTTLIDGTNQQPPGPDNHVQPAFFSGDMRSLSDSFAALSGESFEEHRDGAIVRQSVIYQWQSQ